jgi:hypothetical protein
MRLSQIFFFLLRSVLSFCVVYCTTLSLFLSLVSNGRMTNELINWKNLEGRNRDLIEVLCLHMPGVTKKNHENP